MYGFKSAAKEVWLTYWICWSNLEGWRQQVSQESAMTQRCFASCSSCKGPELTRPPNALHAKAMENKLIANEGVNASALLQQCPTCPSAAGPLPKGHKDGGHWGEQALLYNNNLAFCLHNQELKTAFGTQNQGPYNFIFSRKGSKNTRNRNWFGCNLPLLYLVSPVST